jgi:tetratricopeptide (TPR) repeat protein
LVEFFDNFRYQQVFSEARRYKYFQSHPLSADRIAALRSRVERQPNYGKPDSPESVAKHTLMKAKLDAFLNSPAQTYVKYKEKDPSFPARYARAIAYYRASEAKHALAAIDALLQEQPNNPYLHELKGQVLFENGRIAESEAPHRRSVELKPDAPLLRVNLGRTLVALDDPKRTDEAVEQLDRALAARAICSRRGAFWLRPTTAAETPAARAWLRRRRTSRSRTCSRPRSSPCVRATSSAATRLSGGARRTSCWRQSLAIAISATSPAGAEPRDLPRRRPDPTTPACALTSSPPLSC